MSNKIKELESKYQFLVEKIVKERSSYDSNKKVEFYLILKLIFEVWI